MVRGFLFAQEVQVQRIVSLFKCVGVAEDNAGQANQLY
jgi:hypothetical protein